MEENLKQIEKISEEIKQDLIRNLKDSLPGDVIKITISLKIS